MIDRQDPVSAVFHFLRRGVYSVSCELQSKIREQY